MTIHGDRRTSNRAEGYDYTEAGWYYITVCTHKLRPMFGDVVDGTMVTNAFGRIVIEEWFRTATLRPDVEMDSFVIMPNHFHGIVVIQGTEPLVRATRRVALAFGTDAHDLSQDVSLGEPAAPSGPRATRRVARTRSGGGPSERSLGVIIGQIKSTSSRRINALRATPGAPVWHRNYYDHIIRNDKDLDRIRTYIAGNPDNWQYDRANRSSTSKETPIA